MLAFIIDEDEIFGIFVFERIRRQCTFLSQHLPTQSGLLHESYLVPASRARQVFDRRATAVEQCLMAGIPSVFVEKFDDCRVDLVRALQIADVAAAADLHVVTVRYGFGYLCD